MEPRCPLPEYPHELTTRVAPRSNWLNGKRHSTGVYQWACGDRYEGEWVAGKMEGQGHFRWANGDEYVGQWRNGRMQG